MPDVWFYFYGKMMHMPEAEVDCTPIGEMCDFIACYQISKGAEEDTLLTDEDMIPED